MIQDIEPRVFYNSFIHRRPEEGDLFLCFKNDTVLVREEKDKLWYPSFADFGESAPDLREQAQYLFAIDDIHYFLIRGREVGAGNGWSYVPTSRFRTETKYWRSFAGAVGWQLNRWYEDHRYCSRCAAPLRHSESERMLFCEACGFQTYPKISPVVIVAIHDGDRLLLTKYRGREYSNFALVAGFVEIGETLEQAVQREVMEEVGLKIRNIRFYKSQPWPFTGTLLSGFLAELDGEDTIRLQEDELSMAVWLERRDVPKPESAISLTSEMIEAFRSTAVLGF